MSETTDLKDAVDKLEAVQEKTVSLPWNFYRGVFYGVGFFVGGTLIVGVIIYVLSLFNTAPLIGDFITKILNVVNSTK